MIFEILKLKKAKVQLKTAAYIGLQQVGLKE
jgi:hypothetical protein